MMQVTLLAEGYHFLSHTPYFFGLGLGQQLQFLLIPEAVAESKIALPPYMK